MKPWSRLPEEGPGRSFGAPDLTLTGAIDRLALERAVADLPAGYRLIFILHDVEGFEHNEIASMLDCSIGNSKSQLHKARLKLRDALRARIRAGGAAMTDDPQQNELRRVPGPVAGADRLRETISPAHPHMQSCELCRALLADLETIAEAARQLFPAVEPPDELWEHIESAIKSETMGDSESGAPDDRLARIRAAPGSRVIARLCSKTELDRPRSALCTGL